MLQVNELVLSDFDATYKVFSSITSTNWTYSLFMQSAIKGHSVVAKKNNEVVGYCICSKVLDELSIEDIAVSPSSLRQGIAAHMIKCVIDIATVEFVNAIFLEVRRSNKAARNLYKSAGFEKVGERKNYYPAYKSAEKEDALVLKYFVS